MAIRLANEPVYLAKTEPCSFPDGLCREKWFECTSSRFGGHAFPGVTDCQHDVLSRHYLGMAATYLVKTHIAGLEVESAARWHRIPSIERKIDDCVLKLVRVDKCLP